MTQTTQAAGPGSAPLRVAMVGTGMISPFHLRAWQKVADVQVVALVDPDSARAAARAGEFGVALRFPDLRSLLEREALDAIDIASPRETHGELVRLAAEAGVAVLCQKPLVPTLAEAEALVNDIGGRVRVMVNQNFRFRPHYQKMSGWIRDGIMGELTGCTIACRSSGLLRGADGRYPAIERQPFIRTEARMTIAEVLIHRVDVARWLCGPLRLVAAVTANTCDQLIGETEATMLFETRDTGMPVVVDGNLACAGYTPLSQDRVELIGRRSRVMLDNDHLRLIGPVQEAIQYDYATFYQQSFDATIAHFVECLRTGKPFLTDPADNLETLRLVEAAYVAAERTGG